MEEVSESLEDFEKPDVGRYWHVEAGAKTRLLSEHATSGKQALEVTFQDDKSCLCYRRTGLDGYGANYSRSLEVLGARFIFHNRFVFDVFNPSDENVRLVVTFHKRPFVFTVKPGANTISIPTEEIASAVYRITQVTHRIAFSVQEAANTTLLFDHLRLERETVGPNMKRYAKCFDFGAADMLRPGFVAVDSRTSYESRRGYGWLEANLNDEKGKLETITSSGAMPLGDLIRDGVKDLSSPFLLDCPDGKYRVHIAHGYHWGGIYHLMPVDYDFVIKAEGEVKHIRLRASDRVERTRMFYGHDQTRYEFDEDIWAKFARDIYGPTVFDVEVIDGQLNLEFLTSPQPDKGFLNFMVVYPIEHAREVEPELRRLWYDIRRRYNRVSYRMLDPALAVELKKPDLHEEYLDPDIRLEKIGMLVARPEFSGRDFVLFARDHLEQVYPDTVPNISEEVSRLEAVGAPGEIVPVTFSIFALHPLKGVRVQVEPLEGPRSREILPHDIHVKSVRYSRRMLGQRSRGDWQYMVVPWYLVGFRTVDIDRYMSRRFWINLRLSPDLFPGRYTSVVRITSSRSAEAMLKLELEVLPFRLRKPEAAEFAVVAFVQPMDPGNEPYGHSARVQNTYRLPRSHVRSVTARFERLHRQEIGTTLETLRAYGFDTVYAGDWLKDIQEANLMLLEPLKLIDLAKASRAAKSRPSTPGGRDTFLHVDPVRRRAYLRALASYNEKVIQSLKAQALKVYFGYPASWLPMIDDPAVARYLVGVYLWRTGADGVVAGPARSSWGDPYHPFDGYGGERGSLLMPSSRGWPAVNTSRILEETREGIKDYRYLITLERLIHGAGKTNEAKRAAQFLVGLREEITGTLSDCVEPSGLSSWRAKPGKAWTADRYNRLRRDITTHILALRETLEVPQREEADLEEWR
ncbi:MAG: hypothetical protein AMK75_02820 [Planctomycetes bacterium SM23_65]|nr:MAG: hypothetical protein AMK75_02820 [Planctomycetes bacterium SM23_65]